MILSSLPVGFSRTPHGSRNRPGPFVLSRRSTRCIKSWWDQVEGASRSEQLALLRAHPDLGTRARVSDASASEQSGAGLDQLTPQEFEQLSSLNAAYRDKYGFPFLFAVRGSTKHDILQALAKRFMNTPEEEYREALQQVYRIARFRIEDSIS